MSESIFLREAISKIEQSEGDCTNNYQEVLIREAQIRLQISIARSLERIADMLEEMNDRGEHTRGEHNFNLRMKRD